MFLRIGDFEIAILISESIIKQKIDAFKNHQSTIHWNVKEQWNLISFKRTICMFLIISCKIMSKVLLRRFIESQTGNVFENNCTG